MAKIMLETKSLGNEFWVEEIHTTIYTLSKCPTKAVLNLTLEEAWLGYKPSVAHMKYFGCTTYAHVYKEKRKKLNDNSLKCTFIGYNIETRSYRLFDHKERRVVISRKVLFDEQGIY